MSRKTHRERSGEWGDAFSCRWTCKKNYETLRKPSKIKKEEKNERTKYSVREKKTLV